MAPENPNGFVGKCDVPTGPVPTDSDRTCPECGGPVRVHGPREYCLTDTCPVVYNRILSVAAP